jgi:hypothetical protein
MSKQTKLLDKILLGTADANIPFAGLCHLLQRLGFRRRVRGSHHIFFRDGVEEILNLQPSGANWHGLTTWVTDCAHNMGDSFLRLYALENEQRTGTAV